MSKRSKWIVALGGLFVLLGASSLVVSVRAVDVSVTAPHAPAVERGLRAIMESSVRERAKDVRVPANVNLRDPELAARAIGHYSAACRTCHGAPGSTPDPWMVIYPAAPDLTRAEVVDAWSDQELFWILKNGVKDTGMMALGPTHKDKDIWAVSAFVRQLPMMTSERYAELVAEYRAKQDAAHHHHH